MYLQNGNMVAYDTTTFTGDNFRIIGQARSSFDLSVLDYVYIKTQNPVLCRQKSSFSH